MTNHKSSAAFSAHSGNAHDSIVNVAIIGARGYSGLELVRILLKHPRVKILGCFANDSSWSLSDYLPESAAQTVPVLSMTELQTTAKNCHTVFLATPVETSMELAPQLLELGTNVIDLSGAFRLEHALFEKTYGTTHSCPKLLKEATYGLVPYAVPNTKKAQLISNPGCYATSILMALLPLLRAGAIDLSSVVIDAKSGTTGAGRKANENQLFAEVDGECLPYRVGKHQHLPEIQTYLSHFANVQISPFMNTSLLPTKRGIISSIYAKLNADFIDSSEKIMKAYTSAYSGYKLATIRDLSQSNERTSLLLKRVVGSARVNIAFKVMNEKLYVFSLIDNLMKGAASQAIENFNRMIDVPVHTSLEELEGVL